MEMLQHQSDDILNKKDIDLEARASGLKELFEDIFGDELKPSPEGQPQARAIPEHLLSQVPHLAMFTDAVHSGHVPTVATQAIGKAWAVALTNDTAFAAAYKAEGKSYTAQRAFRLKWAQEQKEMLEKTVIFEEHEEEEDSKEGGYMSLFKIWEAEGKDLEGLRASQKWVAKCVAEHKAGNTMCGRALVRWHPWTERFEFLYFKDMFKMKIGSSKTIQHSTGNGGGGGGGSPPGPPPGPPPGDSALKLLGAPLKKSQDKLAEEPGPQVVEEEKKNDEKKLRDQHRQKEEKEKKLITEIARCVELKKDTFH
jgi:hypothetical protein